MRMTSKLVLCLFLTGCASMGQSKEGKSFDEKYSETAKVVQTCMYNAIVGVFAVPVKGLVEFHDLCTEHN